MTFDGHRARQRRDALNLSRHEVARLAGMREDRLGRLERGEADPHSAEITRLSEILGVSADYLLGATNEPDAPDHI